MSYLKVSSSQRKISTCIEVIPLNVCEMHSKTARLPISEKTDVGFLREHDALA